MAASFQILAGPPPALRLDATHPLASQLAALLGVSNLAADIALPAVDDNGLATLPLPAAVAQLTLAGVVLRTTAIQVRIVEPHALLIEVEATLPAPFTALTLHGMATATGEFLNLDLRPASTTTLSLAAGVAMTWPASMALQTQLSGADSTLHIGSQQERVVLQTPAGSVFVRALEFDASGVALSGSAQVQMAQAFAAQVDDVVVRTTPGGIELLSRARATARFDVAGVGATIEADTLSVKLDASGIDTLDIANAALNGSLGLLGEFASAGALAYRRVAPLPNDPAQTGQYFELSVGGFELPGLLDQLAPDGSATVQVWPDHDALIIDTTLSGELPFLGAFEPVSARLSKFGVPITIELNGLTTPALSLGPDLPTLSLGPVHLQVVLDRVLTGRVEDELSQPLASVVVTLHDRAGTALAITTSDADGDFEFVGVAPQADHLSVADRRVTAVSAVRGDDGDSAGEYGIVEITASGPLPIDVPAGFPVLGSERVEVGFHWRRGVGVALALPTGLPPVELGPLMIDITSLDVSRTVINDDVLTHLALGASATLTLPVFSEPIAIGFTDAGVDWRDAGERRFTTGAATATLPAAWPVLGGARFDGSLSYATLPQGAGGTAQGLIADLTMIDAGNTSALAGIDVVVSNNPTVRMTMAPSDEWPAVALTAGSVGLGFRFGQFHLDALSFDEQQWLLGVSADLDLNLSFVSLGAASGSLHIAGESWGADLQLSDIALDLGALQVAATQASVAVHHDSELDEVRIGLQGVDFGPLGVQANATLVVRERRVGQQVEHAAFIEAQTAWENLSGLPTPHPNFPALPTSGAVMVQLRWHETAVGHDLSLHLAGVVDDGDSLFAFVPAAFRPQIDHFAFTLAVDFVASDLSSARVEADVALRLPEFADLPGADLVTVTTGDENGLIHATLAAGYEANADGNNEAFLRFELFDAVTLAVALPGMPQDTPVLEAALTRVAFELDTATGGSQLAGVLQASGAFILQPPDPPSFVPLGQHMRALLEQTGLDVISGEIDVALGFTNDGAAIEAKGRFDNAELSVDLFAMLSDMTRGLGAAPAADNDIELSLDVGFELIEVGFRFGPPLAQLAAAVPGNAASFEFDLGFGFHIGEMATRVDLRLSDEELAIALDTIAIPISVPVFPLLPTDLDGLSSDADWTARRAALETQMQAIPEPAPGTSSPERVALWQRMGALDAVKVFWDRVDDQRQGAYLGNARFFVEMLRDFTGAMHVDTDVALELTGIGFYFPFADPTAMRVQGDAALVGFAPDDPLAFLGALQFGLGISADRIFFQLKTSGPIELPDFGRYPGGSVDVSQFSIGYGYTRNSLAVNLAGQIVLPPQLIEDADTSQTWGAGVRLPSHSKLGFRLDLIPVTLGPVDFIVPLLEFEADLRAPYSPPLLDVATCQPYWDGLQVHVPGVVRADLKHVAFSPFFTVIPAPNLRLDWDLQIGDDQNGLRIIANDFHYFAGVMISSGAVTMVPFLAAATEPYFDNLCVRLSVAGIGIQFDLERPFPSANPMALFEVLALLSDPMMRVDSTGHLANTVRISLRHARLLLPDTVRRLFPDTPGIDKEIDVTLNLGTLITAAQTVWGAAEPVLDTLMTQGGDLAQRIEDLANDPPQIDPQTLLALLPAELRKVRVHGSLGGFEAGAVLLIVTPDDATDEMRRRGAARPDAPQTITYSPQQGAAVQEVARLRPDVPAGPHARRHIDPEDPANNLFSGIEFAAFDADDLAALPEPRRTDLTGVMMGAHVTLAPGQRVRFLGALYDDGSFGLVSAIDVDDLKLRVAGIEAALPLDFDGRLTLAGRARQYRAWARITAEFSLHWDALPVAGLAVIDVPQGALSLDSSGTFRAQGEGSLALLNGQVVMGGSVDVSQTHCFVDGSATFSCGNWNGTPVIALELGDPMRPSTFLRCRVGPGQQFLLSGEGRALILGHEVLNVSARLSERGISMAAVLRSLSLRGWDFPSIEMALRGEVEITGPGTVRYLLEGETEFEFGGIALRGRGGLRGTHAAVDIYAEGALLWQGCRWASGRVEVGTSGVRLSGATSFTVDLTPAGSGLGTEFANLVLQVSLEGSFELNAPPAPGNAQPDDLQWQLGACEIEGDCVLGVQLPSAGNSGNHDQVLPLARHRFEGALSASSPLDLLHLDDLQLLPFQDDTLQITVPTVTVDTVNKQTLSIRHRHTTDPTFAFVLGNYIKVISGSDNWYFPGRPRSNTYAGETAKVEFSIPTVAQGQDQTFSLNPSLAAGFSVCLCWKNGELGLRVMRNTTKVFEETLSSLVAKSAHVANLLDG